MKSQLGSLLPIQYMETTCSKPPTSSCITYAFVGLPLLVYSGTISGVYSPTGFTYGPIFGALSEERVHRGHPRSSAGLPDKFWTVGFMLPVPHVESMEKLQIQHLQALKSNALRCHLAVD